MITLVMQLMFWILNLFVHQHLLERFFIMNKKEIELRLKKFLNPINNSFGNRTFFQKNIDLSQK